MGGPIPQIPHLHGMVLQLGTGTTEVRQRGGNNQKYSVVNSGFPDAKVFSPKSSAIWAHTLKKAHQPKVKEYRLEGVAEY